MNVANRKRKKLNNAVGKIGELNLPCEEDWLIWRVWKAGKGDGLKEIENNWTYQEVMIANAILDMDNDYDNAYNAYQTRDM